MTNFLFKYRTEHTSKGFLLSALCCLAFLFTPVNITAQDSLNSSHSALVHLTGESGESSGSALAAGDFNGDGIQDVVVGIPYQIGEVTDNPAFMFPGGGAYIVFGTKNGFNSSGSLPVAATENGFIFTNLQFHPNQHYADQAGFDVVSGDINNDGYDDIIIGAPLANIEETGGTLDRGEIYIIYGAPNISNLLPVSFNGNNGFKLEGAGVSDIAGKSLAVGDVNGDGMDDVIIMGRQSNNDITKVHVLYGSNTGFTHPFDLSSLDGSNGFKINTTLPGSWYDSGDISSGDINADGIDDVLIGVPEANPNGVKEAGTVQVLFGNNTGFAAAIDTDTLDSAEGFQIHGVDTLHHFGRSLATGDINNDGIDDMLISAEIAAKSGGPPASSKAYVIFGNNSGFSGGVDLTALDGSDGFVINIDDKYWHNTISKRNNLATGDLNRDGIPDLIYGMIECRVCGETGTTYVLFGRSGAFNPAYNNTSFDGTAGFQVNGGTGSGAAVLAADVDGDGFDELLIGDPSFGNQAHGRVSILNMNVIPELDAGLLTSSPALNSDVSINFNFIPEGSSVTQSNLQVYGSQTGRYTGTISGRGTNTISFNPDQDFKPGEQITATLQNTISSEYGIKLTKGFSRSFITSNKPVEPGSYISNSVSTTVSSPSSVFPADLDGDGDVDLISTATAGNSIVWHQNDGTGIFSRFTIATSGDGLSSPVDVLSADVDNDGDMDVLSASQNNDRIHWFENDGSESFTTHLITSSTDGVQSIFTADLDSDGDTDVLSASENDDTIAWFENDGSENFTKKIISNNADGASDVLVVDINGDGSLDIVGSAANEDTLSWYENVGDSLFTRQTISSNTGGITNIAAIDMDGDGDMDMTAASQVANTLAWFENNGSQNFTKHIISSSANGITNLQTADLDGNGTIDIISTGSNTNTLAFYSNDGNQNFTETVVSSSQQNIQSIVLGDIDGGNGLDIISSSINDNNITWYKPIPVTDHSSLTLNGTDNFIDADSLAPQLSGSSAFTFEGWIKPDFANQTDPNDVTILNFTTSGSRIFLGNNASKDQILRVSGTTTLTGPALTDNRWTHVAYTISSGTGTLYIDGVGVGTHATTAGFGNDDDWNIGAVGSPGSLSDIFAGSLDELRFWNTARTEDQIRRNMFQRIAKNESGLVAYFPLDESSGSTVFDRSVNSIKAALVGTPNWSGDAHPYGTFITGGEGWRILTAPAANISYATLLDTLWTQGFTGADATNGASSVYLWDESTFSFSALSNGTAMPTPGSSFIAYVYEDDNNDGTGDGFPKMIRIDSTQNDGQVAPSLSYTDNGTPANDGWNLIGNPYGTSIDWDAPDGLSRSNLDASLYVWNHSAGSGNGAYQSWNGVAGTLSNGKLAPLQGFWVKANAENPSISFSALARSNGGVFRKQKTVPQLTFTLADSSGSSQTLVMFHEQALLGKDDYDAYKLGSLNGESLALYSLLEDSSALEINALPLEFEETLEIPVAYSGSSELQFSLNWDYKLLPEDWEFILIDHIAETSIDLRKDSIYIFTQDTSKAKRLVEEVLPPSPPQLVPNPLKRKVTADKPHFTMRVSKASAVSNEPENDLPSTVELQQNYPNPFNPSTTIAYGLPETGEVTLEVFDILGRKVATLLNGENKTAGRHTVNFNASNLASGMYIYRLRAGNVVKIKKLTLIK